MVLVLEHNWDHGNRRNQPPLSKVPRSPPCSPYSLLWQGKCRSWVKERYCQNSCSSLVQAQDCMIQVSHSCTITTSTSLKRPILRLFAWFCIWKTMGPKRSMQNGMLILLISEMGFFWGGVIDINKFTCSHSFYREKNNELWHQSRDLLYFFRPMIHLSGIVRGWAQGWLSQVENS